MSQKAPKRPPGQMRQSQIISTFGPGAMIDLPKHSVIVGGLDDWTQGGEEIHEPRLVAKVEQLLDRTGLKLFAPPPDTQDAHGPQTGVLTRLFPEWFITQDVEQKSPGAGIRSRLLVHRRSLTKGRFIDADKKKRRVVPIRFVRACIHGHIGDIHWHQFVHQGRTECRRQLLLDERGTTGDISEIWVRCECGAERSVGEAARLENVALGRCDGNRPWLGAYAHEDCSERTRLLVRSASNAYFPQVLTVISLPDSQEQLAEAVSHLWEHFLQYVESLEELEQEVRKKPPVRETLAAFKLEQVFEEIQARRGTGGPAEATPVKQAEVEVLRASEEELGTDVPDGTFYARALPRRSEAVMAPIERVVLVHRLREVTVQVGFTRFESTAPDVEGELDMGVTRASLARELRWLPANENRGEGFFLLFDREHIAAWQARPEVQERGRALSRGFSKWQQDHPGSKRQFIGMPYILLHTVSHLLMNAVSLACGYPASSIRERIYASNEGYGILLYTGSPDAEGTLGGLVEVGRGIEQHLSTALEMGALCSNDPVCSQHVPANDLERRFLHGAACHGCVLVAETSCEQRNDFLDRALVVPTVEQRGTAFFDVDGI